MRLGSTPLTLLTLLLLSSCVYVSKGEFEEYWDVDGDGWPLGDDCNDASKFIYPWAADYRGDGCDADCGAEPDTDGDDWPDAADCDPEDPDTYPCSAAEQDGDDLDHDCDGFTTVRPDACFGGDPDYEKTPLLLPDSCKAPK